MASRSVNRVILLGRIGKDAESKFTAGGMGVATFSVATNYRKKEGDGWKDLTEWTDIVLFKAENVAPYLKKGTQVYIEGRLQTRNYEKDGRKVYKTEVIANELVLLGGEQKATIPASAPMGDIDSFDPENVPF